MNIHIPLALPRTAQPRPKIPFHHRTASNTLLFVWERRSYLASMNQAVKRAERALCGRPLSLYTSQGGFPNAGPSIALPSHKGVHHCSSRGDMATTCRSKLHSPKVAGKAGGFRVAFQVCCWEMSQPVKLYLPCPGIWNHIFPKIMDLSASLPMGLFLKRGKTLWLGHNHHRWSYNTVSLLSPSF